MVADSIFLTWERRKHHDERQHIICPIFAKSRITIRKNGLGGRTSPAPPKSATDTTLKFMNQIAHFPLDGHSLASKNSEYKQGSSNRNLAALENLKQLD